METKANYVLIGIFTLLMIAAGFGLVLFFSGAGAISVRRTYEIVFDGPVGGLARGSSVTFSGLKVGEVTWVDLDAKDPRRVIAYFQVFRNLALRADIKARLESQGLTGNTVIALSGGSPESPLIKGESGEAPIHGEASEFSSLLGRVDAISTKADAILTRVDKLIADNGDTITDTLKNVETFSKALSQNAPAVQDALAAVAELSRRAAPLADRLTELTGDADKIIKGVDAGKVGQIVDDAASFAKRVNEASANLSGTLAQIDSVVNAIDPKKVASLMDGADALGVTLQENRGNIDRLFKNASELSAKLNDSADKLDGVLDTANKLLNSTDVKGPIGQIGDAAKSLRQLADDLDARLKEISYGVARFSNSGLKQYEALAVDARKAIADVDRLVRSLESNPSQIIFGAKKTQ